MSNQNISKIKIVVIFAFAAMLFPGTLLSQDSPAALNFRIGERLTYSVWLGDTPNVAYAESEVVSNGRMEGRQVVELSSRIKTLNFASAAFYLIDESRTTFVASDTGYPVYIRKKEFIGGLPKESSQDFLTTSNTYHDINSFLYAIRNVGSGGTINFRQDGKLYTATFDSTGSRKVATDIGVFNTALINVQSDFLTAHGISSLRINVSLDEDRIPVQIRLRTSRGLFKALIASVRIVEPARQTEQAPAAAPTPRPSPTPVAAATPLPYVDNRPLAPDIPFSLGETLEYNLAMNGNSVGGFILQAKERNLFEGGDSLLLTALPKDEDAGNSLFSVGDFFRTRVDPENFLPQLVEVRMSGSMGTINQFAKFDSKTGFITVNGSNRIEAPAGTHGLLSLLYAVRSFNLTPSRDLGNPVNDTRVAVFWGSRHYVFSLRPSSAELVTIQGEKIPAQMITVITGDPELDRLNIRLWLGIDQRRLPLRFAFGDYQADLVSR